MEIISSPWRKNVGPTEQNVDVQNQIELSDLDNSTTAEGEHSNSESFRIDVPDIKPRNETNICKIFKVPEQNIHEDNEHSFKPKILSIGPYNYGSSHLRGMESMKSICLHNILGNWDSENYYDREEIKGLQNEARSFYTDNIAMESMKLICRGDILGSISENYYDTDEIQELQNQARSFYSENIAMEPKSFTQMLLLDGCFILAALTGMKPRPVEDMENLKQQEAFNRHDILHDLLLVENQIPFFVLRKIHKITAGEGETTESLKEEIATRVERVLQQYPKAIRISEICQNDFHHLVHLCHMFFRPSPNSVKHHHDQAVKNQWHRAMQYHEVGVKFRVKDSSTPYSLLDVTFSNGTMEIPHLSIDANTESIFSNLILFEQSGCPHAGKYINAYITFMSKLLSDKEDVKFTCSGKNH